MKELERPLYDLCRCASRELRRLYVAQLQYPVAGVLKSDGTPVTEADARSHDILLAGLARITPGVPVVSEEAGLPSLEERSGWHRHWLVDPLDGTREFIAGRGHFSINLALVEGGVAILGVIYLPLTGEMYWGGRHLAPVLCYGGACRPVVPRAVSRQRPLKFIYSRGGRSQPAVQALKARFSVLWPECLEEVRGSAWKFCRLAEGGADIYPRFGVTSEWDTAAGQAILEAAGGLVLDEEGQVLRYTVAESMQNRPFVALAPARFDWSEMLAAAAWP